MGGDMGVDIEGRVSAGEADVSMPIGNRAMSSVLGLDWTKAGS